MSSLLKGVMSLDITPTSNVISGNLTVTDTNNTTLFSITSGVVNAVALTVNGVAAATTTYVNNAISMRYNCTLLRPLWLVHCRVT